MSAATASMGSVAVKVVAAIGHAFPEAQWTSRVPKLHARPTPLSNGAHCAAQSTLPRSVMAPADAAGSAACTQLTRPQAALEVSVERMQLARSDGHLVGQPAGSHRGRGTVSHQGGNWWLSLGLPKRTASGARSGVCELARGGFREQRELRDRMQSHACCTIAEIGIGGPRSYIGPTVETASIIFGALSV